MLRTRVLALTLAAAFVTPAIAQEDGAAVEAREIGAQEIVLEDLVSSQVQPLVDAEVVPGVIVGVLRDGKTEFYGFGGVDADGMGAVPDGRTLYEIGSITKVFTGVLLAEMAQRGEVELDEPISACGPDDWEAPQLSSEPIRLWHLATHTSGLPRMPTNMPAADPGDPFNGYTLELMYEYLDGLEPDREPGESYEYSNLAAGLLGRLLQERAEQEWDTLVAERIFEPAGMHDSFVQVDEQTEMRVARPSAEGMSASRWGGADALAPCGAIVSCAADLLRFAQENIEPSEPGSVLAKALAASHEPRFRDPATGQVVGLGWHLAGDGQTIWHNGGTGGYSTMFLVNKPTRTAVVVLANGAAPTEITIAGDRIMKGLLSGAEQPAQTVERAREVEGEHLERLVGDYDSAWGFTIYVTREGGRLGARLTGQPRFRVYPEGDGDSPLRFQYRVVPAALVFELGEDGVATAVTLEQNGQRMRAERVE